MKIQEILNKTEHRPWKLPKGKWRFYQEWNTAVFLHWQVDKKELRKLVPEEIEIDLFDGKAWVSIVAFTMKKVRPRNLPPFPPLSNFDEINIRTYVKYNGKAGVYFLSIEGGTKISCLFAKRLSELPYRYSRIKRLNNKYHSINSDYKDHFEIKYKVGQELTDKSELDRWLTERYALFQDTKSFINEFDIHHIEWPISKVDLEEIKIEYFRFEKLFHGSPILSHYSNGVQVVAWDKKKHKKRVATYHI